MKILDALLTVTQSIKSWAESKFLKKGDITADSLGIYVQKTAPSNANIGAIWVDTSAIKDDSKIKDIHLSNNLFDYTSNENEIGRGFTLSGWPMAWDPETSVKTEYSYSHFIPVKKGMCYYIVNAGIADPFNMGFFYIREGEDTYHRLDGYVIQPNGEAQQGDDCRRIIVPADINSPQIPLYIRIFYKTSNENICAVIPCVQQLEITNPQLNSTVNAILNPLYNKTLAVVGDSICKGLYSVSSGTTVSSGVLGYGEIIATRNNMTCYKNALGGATVTKYDGRGYIPEFINVLLEKITTGQLNSPDYVIIEGGINDCTNKVPLGQLTDDFRETDSESNSTLDESTFYGAFERMCRVLLEKFPDKKVGYIAVHASKIKFSPIAPENENYYLAAKNCCQKYGIPFCDLTTITPPTYNTTPSDGATINTAITNIQTHYTVDGDGLHPNEKGYNTFYAPKIEAWLKTL